MSLLKILSRKQCPDIMPVRQSAGSQIVTELRCVLDKDHEGMHRDKNGSIWVNPEDILRKRGML